MADKKISALTAATTPLAGTEVLPIVQAGATVKVEVNDMLETISVTSVAANSEGNIFLRATDSLATNVGTQIGLGGKYNASSYFPFAAVAGRKENATNNNVAGYLAFLTTTSGGTLTERMRISSAGDATVNTGNLVIGTAGKGITNSTGSVALNFSTVGTALTGGTQSVLTGSFNNVGTAQTVTPDDTRGGYIVITAIQPGIGSTTYTLPFVKRGGVAAVGTASKAILTADPLLSVTASGGGIVITPVAANTYITYAIYYTPLGI